MMRYVLNESRSRSRSRPHVDLGCWLLLRLRRLKSVGGCFNINSFEDEIKLYNICHWSRTMAKNSSHWSQGLLASMNDANAVVHSDDTVVVIKDKYPKALFHFLVLPRQKISSLKSVTAKDLSLLEYIHKKGEEIAQKANTELKFRFGYHAVPSMSHLHMHVISQDFNSPCLKTKKHWNSFTTEYFVDSEGKIEKVPLNSWGFFVSHVLFFIFFRCHVCKKQFPTIPSLKAHIVMHDVTVLKDS
ncbi:hypothetical protein EGW08_017584 [Elysia chlorotica]|uniref:HIT domain-containing protein n=1 Tax=Elysia chlorotica TaxID=188477 RepID=A0A433SZB9_ELYCH|nr:hypothetical protein EGW08_017584 [Elysia chlorotica]